MAIWRVFSSVPACCVSASRRSGMNRHVTSPDCRQIERLTDRTELNYSIRRNGVSNNYLLGGFLVAQDTTGAGVSTERMRARTGAIQHQASIHRLTCARFVRDRLSMFVPTPSERCLNLHRRLRQISFGMVPTTLVGDYARCRAVIAACLNLLIGCRRLLSR